MPIPRIPTTIPSMIRTPIFFSRRASHTFENPPAQRYLEIPRFRKADRRRTHGKTIYYRGAEDIHSISNLVGPISQLQRDPSSLLTYKEASRPSRLRNLNSAKM